MSLSFFTEKKLHTESCFVIFPTPHAHASPNSKMMEMLLLVKNGWSNFNKKLLATTMPMLHISPQKLGNFQLFMRNFSLLMTTPSPRLQTTMWQIKRCGRRPKKLMVTNLAEVAQFEGRGESANQCSFPIFS